MSMRRFSLVLGLLAYLLAGQGILPSASFFARHSPFAERFPCEGCACGCASARECWLNCCCHSLQERLEWARANGVTPPAYAAAAIERETDEPDTCELCRAANHPRAAARPAGFNRGLVMSALGCRGISEWIAFTAPIPQSALPGELIAVPRCRGTVARHHADATSNNRLEVPTPPPRAA